MGLASLSPITAANKPQVVTLKHPATGAELSERIKGKDVPVTVSILGRDADAVKAAAQDIAKRRTAGETITDAEVGSITTAAAICGWSAALGIEKAGDLPYSPENALKLLQHADCSWIAEQIVPFSMRRANFYPSKG